MKSFIRFFATNHLLANLITVIIILLGINSVLTIKRDMFPSVDLDMMAITTRYPGASPEDVELNVTNKLEDELKSVDGIDQLTSYSLENISVIDITIETDARDKEKVKRDIRDAVGRVSDFPVEVTDSPFIFEIKSENFEIIYLGIGGDLPYAELREHARRFEKKLKRIDGISKVETIGYFDREIIVEVSQDKIENYQMPMREIVSSIQMRNIRATGGSFESYTSDKNIVALAQFKDPGEVGDVIIRSTFDGPQVKVKDVAEIIDGFEPQKLRFHMNGKEVIGYKVFKNESADIIRVVDRIKAFVKEEQKLLPSGVEVIYSSDISRWVQTRLNVLSVNGIIGLILVLIVLFIFLDFRTAFWVAMGIPLTGMAVIFMAPYFNVYLDLITMMGMIIVIGLIVDDAIVVAENISYYRDVVGMPKDEAAITGIMRVLRPVFATILTTIIAFSPFFFMEGMLGKFIFSIPLVIVLALVISFLEVVLILPAHITSGKDRKKLKKVNHGTWFDSIRVKFQRMIFIVLKLRYVITGVFVILLIGTFWYAGNYMQFILFPGETAEQFYVSIELPNGSSLDATEDKIIEIENLLDTLPDDELESYWINIGNLGGGGFMAPGESENWAFIYASLTPFSERDRTASEIVDYLKREADLIGGFEKINFEVDSGGPPIGRPITLRIIGSENQLRTAMADSVMSVLSSIEGVKDLDRDDKLGKEQVEINIDYSQLSKLGLTVADVAENVRLAYDGMIVTSVRYGDEDVEFRVMLEEKSRKKPNFLGELVIPNNQGRLIRLKEVATFETGPGPSSFFHFDAERSVTITGDMEAQSAMTPLQVTELVVDQFSSGRDWPGMQIIVGGEAEETQKSMVSLAIAMLMAGIGIYIVLILLFSSVTQPMLVMLAIPFGLVGVVGAFALHDEPLGFLAIMGVIGMMGVVVNDSLILVNFINVHRKEFPDKKFIRIVAEGTAGRLRPILLTSITTVAGLLPTAYGIGGNDPFIAPMALALGYGILFATPLTLILLPCMYAIQHDLGNLIRKIPRLAHFRFIHHKI
nr:efflux RND transporter permease subunit [FCB group bacterium]